VFNCKNLDLFLKEAKMKIFKHYIFLMLFLAIPMSCLANQIPALQLDTIMTYRDISANHAEYWITQEDSLDINFILKNESSLNFKPVGNGLPNTKEIFWCKWQVQNMIKDPSVIKNWILDIGKADMGEVFFIDTSGRIINHQVFGELMPMSLKSLSKKHVVERIPFSLPTNEVITIYIKLQRISGFPPQLKLEIHQLDFYKRDNYLNKSAFRWMFFGLLFTLSLIGIGVFGVTKDKAFLYYGLFLFGMSGYMIDAFLNVYGNMSPMREHPILVMYVVYFLVTIMNVFHINFIRAYIKSGVNFPKWDKVAHYVMWINVAFGVIAWGVYFITTDEFFTDKIIIPVIIATYLFIFTIIIPIIWYRKWTVENLLIFASVTLFITAILINTISIFQGTNLKIPETQVILSLVILVFSIGSMMGLAYRSHQHQKEKLSIQRVKDLSEFKTKFYQNITHEFRTPLTIIKGVTNQITSETVVNRFPELGRKLEMVNRNADNLLSLVNRLLKLSELESGEMKLDYKNGGIIMYLKYLVESIETFAESKNIQLQFLTKMETLNIDYDEEKIRQILYNLISNAIKFSDRNSKVKVIVESVLSNNLPHVLIQVKDEGKGISQKDIALIFDRFFHGEQPDNFHQGSGIGLALTKELIILMNGEIVIESKEGIGTLVKLFLPITNGVEAKHENIITPSLEEFNYENTPNLAHRKNESFIKNDQAPLILLIEDNWDVLEYLKSILENNYQIEVARDGQEGIEIATEKIPDLIISDVVMPKMNGYQVLEFIKEDEKTSHIPFILLTAKVAQQDKLDGLTLGADAYLTKPFDKEELELRIRNLLAARKVLQEKLAQSNKTRTNDLSELNEKDQQFLTKLTDFIEQHISEDDLDVVRLQRAVKMSRTQLHNKLKALTGLSATKFRKKIRMEIAYKMVKEKTKTISEIAYDVGYKYPSHFSNDFKITFGMTPSEV
jgi:signal transduction histidine kinase/DNA-binding response OmpR family regulator